MSSAAGKNPIWKDENWGGKETIKIKSELNELKDSMKSIDSKLNKSFPFLSLAQIF